LTPGADLALALDPAAFSRAAGIEPDLWQRRLLRSTAQRVLINCSRQSGKSTVTGALAAHTAVYVPDSLVALLSPSQRQSSEIFRKVLDFYAVAAHAVPSDVENRLTMELENGSRVVALPGKEGTIRGLSGVSLLIIDEASRVPDALYASVRPMLAVSGGRLVILSTPFGTRGFFYEAWRNRVEWDYYEVPATDCPRITPAFLEEERRTIGDWWYSQEYQCQFLDSQTSAFRAVDIDQMFDQEVEQWSL
jgi:hypothetical protein